MDFETGDANAEIITDQRRAQDEFTLQLVDAVTPPILQGFVSLQQAAIKLCQEQGEDGKYLMMFQNMIARIPGWNAGLITKEVERIKASSQIGYLPDLVTAVHIIHLRILSSVRVGMKPKHIEIDPPNFEQFIHRVYCECGRKMWTHAYLFRNDVNDLDHQRNMHECEKIIRDAVISTVRSTLPVETILRAYIDEAEEIRLSALEEQEQEQASDFVADVEDEQYNPNNHIQKENDEDDDDNDFGERKTISVPESIQEESESVSELVSSGLSELANVRDSERGSGENVSDTSSRPSVAFASNNEVLDMGTNRLNKVDMAPPTRSPAPMPGPPLEEVPLRDFSQPTPPPPAPQPLAISKNSGFDDLEVIDLSNGLGGLSGSGAVQSSAMPTLKLDTSDW